MQKTFGLILFTGGLILMGYALLLMDTSIAVNYTGGNILGLPDRVNNLGLMAERQNYLITSGIVIIIGLVLAFTAKSRTESIPNIEDGNENKKCPHCAELVKKEAKICRFCNYKFTEKELKKSTIKQNALGSKNSRQYCSFIYQDPLSGKQKKYIYVNKNSAEYAYDKLKKTNNISQMGLVKVLDT